LSQPFYFSNVFAVNVIAARLGFHNVSQLAKFVKFLPLLHRSIFVSKLLVPKMVYEFDSVAWSFIGSDRYDEFSKILVGLLYDASKYLHHWFC